MKNTLSSALGLILVVAIIAISNLAASSLLRPFAIDLTEDGLYSLSEGTSNLLSKLESPVSLKFYFSRTDTKDIPGLQVLGDRVENLLREFDRAGGDKLEYDVYDPRPDSDEADWAGRFGLRPLPIADGEAYFGLVAQSANGEDKSIPIIDFERQEFIEYDFAKLINSISQTEKSKVGIISSLAIAGGPGAPNPLNPSAPPQPSEPWVFFQQLREGFNAQVIEASDAEAVSGLDPLILLHPKGLGEEMLKAVDAYAVDGGNLLVLVDPYCQADIQFTGTSPNSGSLNNSSDLNILTEKWGVTLEKGQVVGDPTLGTTVRKNQASQPESFLVWLSLGGGNAASEDIVTADLESLLIPWAGVLTAETEKEGIEPLLWTSDNAKVFSSEEFDINGGDPSVLNKAAVVDKGKKLLGVRLSKKLESNYGHTPKAENAVSNVLIISDVDFISDRYSVRKRNIFGNIIVQALNDNLSLGLNSAENLLGSDDLIKVRTRGRFSRPFDKVEQIRQQAEAKWKNEEQLLVRSLSEANARLQKLQSSSEGDAQLINEELTLELEQFRQEKLETQQRLRVVRRGLREEVEGLGRKLFMLNTFLIPGLLLVLGVGFYFRKMKV